MIGSELVAFTLFGVVIDWLTGWLPWVTVTLTLLGLVTVMIQIGRAAMVKTPTRGAPKDTGG